MTGASPAVVTHHAPSRPFLRLGIDDPRWTRFVGEREDTLGFHLPAWSEVLARSYGFRPFAVAVADESGELRAGIPVVEVRRLKRTCWVSLPFSDRCPPLGDADDVERLLEALHAEVTGGGVSGIEIRAPVARTGIHSSLRGVTHKLSLTLDPDELLKTFSKSQVQRNIARGRREGVVVRLGERREDLVETFFRLHLNTRRRQGLPIQPNAFFHHLWDRMIEPGHAFVLLSFVDDAPAAAAVFLIGSRTITYKYGASASNAWPKRPNHPLFWEAIRWACEQGYTQFDFGRSDFGNRGLRAFKAGWGTEERELAYSTIGMRPFRPPLALVSAVGPLIRHAPSRLSLVLGRMLYRFAG